MSLRCLFGHKWKRCRHKTSASIVARLCRRCGRHEHVRLEAGE